MCLFFDPYTFCLPCLHFFSEIQKGTLHQKGNLFLFLKEHHTFFGQPTFSSNNGGRLYYKLVGRLQQLLGWCFDWSETSRTQASLFGEGQDGVSHHNA
jgi:hypothetical protein